MGVTQTGPETTDTQRNPEDFRYHNPTMRPSNGAAATTSPAGPGSGRLAFGLAASCGTSRPQPNPPRPPYGETHQVDHCPRQQPPARPEDGDQTAHSRPPRTAHPLRQQPRAQPTDGDQTALQPADTNPRHLRQQPRAQPTNGDRTALCPTMRPSTRGGDYVASGSRLGTFGFRLGRELRDISASPKPPSSPLRGDTSS
jgi:hypothetical protein